MTEFETRVALRIKGTGWASAIFSAALISYCLWVLSLPAFPSHDGPIHLYYVKVMEQLFRGNPQFAEYFAIRMPPPPYTLQYLLLLALELFASPPLAEKLFVCLILIVTSLAVRFICGPTLGRQSSLAALLVLPLLLDWPLFMGFHNFCLSIGLGLWALGLWLRAYRRGSWKRHLAVVAMMVLTLLCHPIPYFLVTVLIGGVMLVRWLETGQRPSRRDALAFAIAMFLASYILIFVDRTNAGAGIAPVLPFRENLTYLVSLRSLTFSADGPAMKVYRFGLIVVLAAALVWAMRGARQRLETRRTSISDLLAGCSILLAVLLPFMPQTANGLAYFSQRLVVLVWIAAILAAALSGPIGRRLEVLAGSFAVLFTAATLVLANQKIRPAARVSSELERISSRSDQYALFFRFPQLRPASETLSFDPHEVWEAARYIRRSGAVLLNDPFVNPPNILPLIHRHNEITGQITNLESANPDVLYRRLLADSALRDVLLAKVDLLMFAGQPASPQERLDLPLLAMTPQKHWGCRRTTEALICEASATQPAKSEF